MRNTSIIELSISIIVLFLTTSIYGQEIIFEWNKTIGHTGNTTGTAIQADSSGFLYACGNFSGNFILNDTILGVATKTDGYLLKMDTLGHLIWFKQFASPNHANINSLCIDGLNHIIVLGNYKNEIIFDTIIHTNNTDTLYSTNMFVAKYNQDGVLVWAKNTGGIEYDGNQLCTDQENNILISGISIDIDLFNETEAISTLDSIYYDYPVGGHWEYFHPTESFMAKYKANGQLEWIKNAGENNHAILSDHQNHILITGNMYHDTYFDQTLVPSIGFETSYLAKYSPQGVLEWVQTSGGSSNNNCGYALTVDEEDNIYQGGQMSGNDVVFNDEVAYNFSGASAFLAKYSSLGIFQWAHEIGTPRDMTEGGNFNRVNSLLMDQDHHIILIGFFKDSLSIANTKIISRGAYDMMLLKYTSEGLAIKAAQHAYHGFVGGNSICLGIHNKLYYTGYTSLYSWDSRDPIYALIGKIDSSIPTSPLGITSNSSTKFTIYPNPSAGVFFIDKPENTKKNSSLIFYNSSGEIIQEHDITKENKSYKIQNPGLYFIKLQHGHHTFIRKLIVN